MEDNMRPLVRLSAGLLVCLFALGCAGREDRYNIKGRILLHGEPFLTKGNEGMRIFFSPLDESGPAQESYAAEYNGEEGTLTVMGKDRKGLPPGKYRISIQLVVRGDDLFRNRLAGAKSPFTCEVVNAASEVTVDLDKAKDVVAAAKR
jgi:hypothetical protein